MEEGESVLEAIYEEDDNLEDGDDIEMVDVEEGEVVEDKSQTDLVKCCGGGDSAENHGLQSNDLAGKANKKKRKKNKKKKRSGARPNFTDINRFVLDTCRHLKEKKSYMVYTAVGCLGVSALSDLVKEVDAIQSCGGQMTADGRRSRNGGGILWNIIKAREPIAYKEIMKKAKEFEKQFKQQNIRQVPQNNKEGPQETARPIPDGAPACVPDVSQLVPQNQHEQSNAERKHRSVHDRIRVPVSYDDLLGNDPKDDSV